MTSDSSRPHCRPGRPAAQLIAITLGLFLLPAALAQDTKPGNCAANSATTQANCAQPTTTAEERSGHSLDWVALEDVPADKLDRQCINCEGRYIDPLAEAPSETPAEDSLIRARSDSTEIQDDEFVLKGAATAMQGNRHMQGDTVVVNRRDESAILTGNVILREPDILLLGDRAEIYTDTGEASLDNGEFVFHRKHMRGTANLLERDADGLVHIHDGNFSYCAPGEDDWGVRAEKMEVDLEEGLATAHNARIEVEGFPVFYTPWLQIPLDNRRRTGFLWPDFGNDSTGGLDITAPVYFNIAPNYDALYAPRFIEERGLNHELQTRYLHPQLGAWTVGGAYLGGDDRYEKQVGPTASNDRWLGVVRQNGLLDQRWRSQIDYSKASDVDYMKDLQTSSLDAQRRTSLLQLAALDYLGDQWLVNLEAQQFQSLADDINEDYKKLPQLTGQYRSRRTPFSLEPVLLAQASNFGTDENRVNGQRLYGEAGLRYPMLWTYGYLTPTVKYRQLNYELSDLQVLTDEAPSAGSAMANLDGGLVFERSTAFADKALMQTLEPRIYYLYSEYDDQTDQPDFDSAELTFTYSQLFRETRFSGRDRLDDANQLAMGLTTRFIDEEDGQSLLSASIGQIFYFRDRKVRLLAQEPALDDSGSEIASEVHFTPNDKLDVRSNLVWDPYSGNMNAGHLQTGYTTDNGYIFNAGYSFRRPLTTVDTQPLTEEASLSAYLPLDNKWGVFAAMNYSIEDNTSVEDMFGVEYDTCCWTVRLLHLRYYNNVSGEFTDFNNPNLERENTTQFQIILKGMGGFGSRITDIMEDMIRGFEEREY